MTVATEAAVEQPTLTDQQLMLLHDAACIVGSLGIGPQNPDSQMALLDAVEAIQEYMAAIGHTPDKAQTAGEFVAGLSL